MSEDVRRLLLNSHASVWCLQGTIRPEADAPDHTSNIGAFAKAVEKVFGTYKINEHEFTNVGIRHRQLANGDVTLDQDAYISTLRHSVA